LRLSNLFIGRDQARTVTLHNRVTIDNCFKLETQFSLGGNAWGACLGKKKVLSESELAEMMRPGPGDVFGVATKLLGYDRIMVKCQDGRERLCRIRGKMKRRVWIRVGDVVLVSPWDFQIDTRGDLVWRYTRGQAEDLRRKGLVSV
jgi:translation initiation factor 1A